MKFAAKWLNFRFLLLVAGMAGLLAGAARADEACRRMPTAVCLGDWAVAVEAETLRSYRILANVLVKLRAGERNAAASAFEAFRPRIDDSSLDGDSLLLLGEIHGRLGNADASTSHFKRALDLDIAKVEKAIAGSELHIYPNEEGLFKIAERQIAAGLKAAALDTVKRAMEIFDRIEARSSSGDRSRFSRVVPLARAGLIQHGAGDPSAARQSLEEAERRMAGYVGGRAMGWPVSYVASISRLQAALGSKDAANKRLGDLAAAMSAEESTATTKSFEIGRLIYDFNTIITAQSHIGDVAGARRTMGLAEQFIALAIRKRWLPSSIENKESLLPAYLALQNWAEAERIVRALERSKPADQKFYPWISFVQAKARAGRAREAVALLSVFPKEFQGVVLLMLAEAMLEQKER